MSSTDSRILITGAAGFIGSVLAGALNRKGYEQLFLVDDFSRADKNRNLEDKRYLEKIDRNRIAAWLEANKVDVVFHLGARTDTTEFDHEVFDRLNRQPSRLFWEWCTEHQVPLIYASSAATYGGGEHGYSDTLEPVSTLSPLNPYGLSKQDFDIWALEQEQKGQAPPHWAGLKFFNVYGPNEYHKGRMASVIFHAFNQIREKGSMKLFRSHRQGIEDGHQSRDFISVLDVAQCLTGLMDRFLKAGESPESGLYNLGTGQARTFLDLTRAVFYALETEPVIEYIDTPQDLRETYQYFTEADMSKWLKTGVFSDFRSLEQGVEEYVRQYLLPDSVY